MSIRNLDYLLAPRSVALIGASTRAGSLGSIIATNLAKGGFNGPLWLVNPKGGVIGDHTVHVSIAELPGTPDLAVIATPPETIPGLITELGARGTRAAVIISAGVTASIRQAALEAARPYLLRIQGPNCLGLTLPPIGLDASFTHRLPPAGDLALVSQSGALITAIVDWASGHDIGFSHIVSLGDMADVDFGDLLDYLAGDTRSRAILLYMEQLTQAPKFMSAARRAARAKPVIAIKSGRHAEGARAAMSHTGALAGSDAAYEAAFRRAGVLRVSELEDLFTAAEMLARAKRLDGEQLLILTNGGGAGVLAADRLVDLDGRLAPLPPSLVAALDAVLPPTWSRANPVDIIGDADAVRYGRALDCIMASQAADAILVMNCPTALASGESIARAVIASTKAASGGRTSTQADHHLLARRRRGDDGPATSCRGQTRHLCYSGCGDRGLHAARALQAGAGGAHADAATDARGAGVRHSRHRGDHRRRDRTRAIDPFRDRGETRAGGLWHPDCGNVHCDEPRGGRRDGRCYIGQRAIMRDQNPFRRHFTQVRYRRCPAGHRLAGGSRKCRARDAVSCAARTARRQHCGLHRATDDQAARVPMS